ncbi:MAG: glycosyltransferase [Cyanobacteria bacterium REEB65]|nr:glycosyltransferase [Cyanobacteria bacterium REEB65]
MTDDQPLVSVITPCFNSAKYLERTLLAVQQQTYPNVEHIVIDGGSTDGTLEILGRYSHVRWLSEPDEGMYDAYNKGLRMAQGKLIGCLNSDDLYPPDALQNVVAAFLNHPQADVLIGACDYIDAAERKLYTYVPLAFNWKRFVSMDFSSLAFPSVFWRQSIHEAIGYYDPRYRMAADFEFYARFKALEVARTSKILAQFRLHGEAQTYTSQALVRREVGEILQSLGIRSTPVRRLSQRLAKLLFWLCCFRPPLVLVGRALRKWSPRPVRQRQPAEP